MKRVIFPLLAMLLFAACSDKEEEEISLDGNYPFEIKVHIVDREGSNMLDGNYPELVNGEYTVTYDNKTYTAS